MRTRVSGNHGLRLLSKEQGQEYYKALTPQPSARHNISGPERAEGRTKAVTCVTISTVFRMLETVSLKSGSSVGQPPLIFQPGPMTVFVGPNNGGKSTALREIFSIIDRQGCKKLVVQDIVPRVFAPSDLLKYLPDGRAELSGGVSLAGHNGGVGFQAESLVKACEPTSSADERLTSLYPIFHANSLYLHGANRLNLVGTGQFSGLHQLPTHVLDTLFRDDALRQRWADLIHDAFGFYPVIDHTRPPALNIRLSPVLPTEAQQKSLLPAAGEFFKNTESIDEVSDGVKAYVGMAATLLSRRLALLFVDEPEAFLHPPLAQRLGADLTTLASENSANVFAATHSADFLLGCISTGRPVSIVRLTYRGGAASARLLDSTRLTQMMRDPLLRSTNVMRGLFYQGAVACEADRDRAFYQEVNERLLAHSTGGIKDSLFLNAHSKQQVRKIIRPLRELGIPSAAILDLDALKDSDFKETLRAAFVPQGIIDSLGMLKGIVNSKLMKNSDDKGQYSVLALPPQDREEAEQLLRTLADYGVFLVPAGEVENWLCELAGSGGKSDWLLRVFKALGDNPDDPRYFVPSSGDVWEFVRSIATWMASPNRKGLPA